METLRIAELAQMCGARLLRGDPQQTVRRVGTDTRRLAPGDCFVALRGPRFDGHHFIGDAARVGASAAVVSDPTSAINSPSALALLQVQDTLTSLHKLATNYRRLMPPTTRVVAVSGACGKTTTKEMIAAVLAERFRVCKTDGNLNNQIGAPLSLLTLEPGHDFGVFELGSSHPGEMRRLADLVRPDIAVVTNIGLAHVEFLGDEAGVAHEEGAPLEWLPRNGDGLAVLNADDKWCGELRARTRATLITVGIEQFADVRASNIVINGDVKFRLNIARKRDEVIVRLKTLGRHQIYNALQAAAVGYGVGMDLDEIREGLETMQFPPMRMERVQIGGACFVNDCYNANVPSMEAALQTVRQMPWPGRKLAVLGDMLELGDWSRPAHLELGALAADSELDLLLTVGEHARGIAEGAVAAGMEPHRVLSVADAAAASETLRALAREGDFILLKGSRKLALETLIEDFRAAQRS
jgi:UDP-N-acetylmuramoyl-tripeptide--D-alanyl-D-alanine ligase